AWRAAAGYNPARGSVATWLSVRARSRAIDRLNSRKLCAPPLFAQTADVPSSDSAETLLERSILHDALKQLPSESREAIELVYFLGYTTREIALRLDVPVGTVKSRIARGMARLRKA